MSKYLGNQPLTKTSYNSIEVVATEGQTVFTVEYNPSFLDVLVNGIELAKSDYTAVDGSTVTLNNGVTAGHIVTFKVWRTFNVINAVTTENIDQTVLGTKTFQDGVIVNESITGTAVTQSSTDTTAGRLLKVGDFGVGANRSPEVTDLTQLIRVGHYRVNMSTAVGVPAVIGSWGSLIVGATDSLGFTFLLHNSSVKRTWLGGRNSQTGVIVWQELYHTGNILGTVSQSGGVPTGAVIERGSNANGEYVKYADGTLICTCISTNVTAATASEYGSWTLPASFTTNTYAVYGFIANSSFDLNYHVGFGVPTTTSIPFQVIRFTTSTGAIDAVALGATMCAIGRWF